MWTSIQIKRLLLTVAPLSHAEATAIEKKDMQRVSLGIELARSQAPKVSPQQIRTVLTARPSASVLALAIELRTTPREIGTTLRSIGIDPNVMDRDHLDYKETWFGRHLGIEGTRANIIHVIEELREAFTDEIITFILGAHSTADIRELFSANSFRPVTEAPGLSAIRRQSELKHQLNEIVAGAVNHEAGLVALEVGQGAGDGTLSYRRLGLVVSIEGNDKHLKVAKARVPHLDIPATPNPNDEDPLSVSPRELQERYSGETPLPSLMFSEPTTFHKAVRRLGSTSWKFNWIDIDPMGFAEASDIDLVSCLSITDDEAIICVTNGGWQAVRFDQNTQMIANITSGCPVINSVQRSRQRESLSRHILEAEAAYRIRQFLDAGCSLIPILLYDGRDGSSGVVRSYYLLKKSGKDPYCRNCYKYDPEKCLVLLVPTLVEDVTNSQCLNPEPSKIPLVKYQALRDSAGRFDTIETGWLSQVVRSRIAFALSKR